MYDGERGCDFYDQFYFWRVRASLLTNSRPMLTSLPGLRVPVSLEHTVIVAEIMPTLKSVLCGDLPP